MRSSTDLSAGLATGPFSYTCGYASEHSSPMRAGNGNTTEAIQYCLTEYSPLLALPVEICCYLRQKMDDFVSLLALSHTCTQFQAIYQDKSGYQAYQRQCDLLMYNLNTPILLDRLHAKLASQQFAKVAIPALGTVAWTQLRNHPITRGLTHQAHWAAFIQKTYITSWDLLLQPTLLEDNEQAIKLMQILVALLPHISNTKKYAKQWIDKTLPITLLNKLVNIDIELGLALIHSHAPKHEVQAFIAQLDPTLSALMNRAWGEWPEGFNEPPTGKRASLTATPYSSFLHYALEQYYIFPTFTEIKTSLKHEGVKNFLKTLLLKPGINCNRRNMFGLTPLMLACKHNREELIALWL